MPASLFHENSEQINQNIQNSNVNNVNSLEEQRALQLALELSMLGMMNEEDFHFNVAIDAEARLKKSQNTTECVPVPSSEHVAEIVGRQGCKIKALRAKTNTYIKTPVRGEEPVFVVTGRKEDVNSAKREILSAADHFSQIRAQRKNTLVGANGSSSNGLTSNVCNSTGQCTIQVRVPYRVVGLCVGPKGATIKRIQQQTSTYIITPSREKEPIFEVTGLPDNVQAARKEIESHIAIRTGDVIDSGSSGNGSSQADDLDTRDYLNNSPQQFGSFVEQLYGSNSNGQTPSRQNSASVAAKVNSIQNLSSLQLLSQQAQNNGSGAFSMFAGSSGLSNGSNGLSSLYSKANNNSLENSFNPFGLNVNGLTGTNKSPDIVDNHSSLFSNFGVDALTRSNLLQHSTSQNNAATATLNSLNSLSSASGNSSSASSNGNLNTSNNILNNLCNGSGLSMLNLQNAKNLLNVNSKFADIYSQLVANNGNLNNQTSSSTNGPMSAANQLLQQQHSINNTAAAVVNQIQLSNGLAQLNVNNSSTNSNHSMNNNNNNNANAGQQQQQSNNNQLNSSNNNSQLANGNSFNVNSLYDRDEGLGDSPTFDSIAAANLATLTNSLAAQIASVNTSTSSTSSNSSGIGSNGLITNGNSSSASSVNSTSSTVNGVSLWPDHFTSGSPTSSLNTNSNSTTNNGSPTTINSSSSSSNSPNAFESSSNSPNSPLSTSLSTAQQVSRA